MITAKRIVRHVNQSVTEYYVHDSIHGWLPVSGATADNWSVIPLEYEYIELRHSMDRSKGGLYGHHILG